MSCARWKSAGLQHEQGRLTQTWLGALAGLLADDAQSVGIGWLMAAPGLSAEQHTATAYRRHQRATSGRPSNELRKGIH